MNVTFDMVQDTAFRALDTGGAAEGVAPESGWACAWLEACGYPGLKMLVEALVETPREHRRMVGQEDAIGIDLENVSCVFSAPVIAGMGAAAGRIFLRNVRHGLYLLPFTVRLNIGIGCPVDPAFAIGGERSHNPYQEKLDATVHTGISVDDALWAKLRSLS